MEQQQTQQKTGGFFRRMIRALDSISFGMGKEREYFTENLSMLVASGMTVTTAIDAIATEVRSRSMKRTLTTLREDVESGTSLSKALEKTRIFREHTIAFVRIGEESGKLAQNLKLVAVQEAKERSFRSKIRSAMMYPAFVLTLTLVIGVAIAWFILPRLATVFSQLDVELPLITKWLIASGVFLGEWGHVAFPVFFLFLGLLVYFTFYFPKTKVIGQTMLFAFPGIGRLIREIELARFGYLLGTLLRAGIPVTDALESLEKATTFPHYQKFYAHLRIGIADGDSFQKSFENYKKAKKLIPTPIQQLIVAGEQSGNLADTLINVSESFEAKTEQTTKNLSVILEPILLVIVWLGVVAVALAVILPIYSLVGGLNTDPSQRLEETPVETAPETRSEASTNVVAPETPSKAAALSEEELEQLRIVVDDVEFLNVRDDASIGGTIVGRVFPDEIYEYTDESDGWYEIVLPEEESGWISGLYVEIISE